MTGRGRRNSPRRLQRVYRDNIQGISEDSMHRLANKAGATRVSKDIYPELRAIIVDYLNNLVKAVVEYSSYSKKKIITEEHVKLAIELMGPKSYFAFVGDSMKKCPVSQKVRLETKIREYQNQIDCLTFSKLPVSRIIREVAQEYVREAKFSENSLIYIQANLEDVLLKILVVAIKIMYNSKHATLDGNSIKLAVDIMKNTCQGQKYHTIL